VTVRTFGNAEIDGLLRRRESAVASLLKSLEHLSREHQYAILTSWLPISVLEDLAKFQERK
jgi:hypothetical protein